MVEQPKYTEPPRFYCATCRTVLLCISALCFVSHCVSFFIVVVFDSTYVNHLYFLALEIPVFIGATKNTRYKMRAVRIILILYMIVMVAYGLHTVFPATSTLTSEKVDDSIGFPFSKNATTEEPLFERKEDPENLSTTSQMIGYAKKIGYVLGFAFFYLQYHLADRILDYLNFLKMTRPVSQA